MIKPEVEVVRFNTEDVIATSGGVTLSGFGDTNDKTNNTFKVGNQTFTNSSGSRDVPSDLITALNNASGSGDSADKIKFWISEGGFWNSLDFLWGLDAEDYGVYNGTYTWKDGTYGYAWYK